MGRDSNREVVVERKNSNQTGGGSGSSIPDYDGSFFSVSTGTRRSIVLSVITSCFPSLVYYSLFSHTYSSLCVFRRLKTLLYQVQSTYTDRGGINDRKDPFFKSLPSRSGRPTCHGSVR